MNIEDYLVVADDDMVKNMVQTYDPYNMTKALSRLHGQIAEIECTINNIHKEIEETELAQGGAKKLKSDFECFVSRKKEKTRRQTKGQYLRSYSSFTEKALGLLTGTECTSVIDDIEGVGILLNNKMRDLQNDLDYCEKEKERLINQRERINAECVAYRTTQGETGE